MWGIWGALSLSWCLPASLLIAGIGMELDYIVSSAYILFSLSFVANVVSKIIPAYLHLFVNFVYSDMYKQQPRTLTCNIDQRL